MTWCGSQAAGLVAAAGKLAGLIAQRGQPPQVGGDLVGLSDVKRQRRPVQPFT
jgi:hypothetical protein